MEDQFADDRRNWALIIVAGGGMTMTAFAACCLWLLQDVPGFVFYLGMAAMIQILVIFTGILGLLVKRSLSVSKSQITISDSADLIPRKEAEEAVLEAVADVPPVTNDSINKSS